MRTDLQRLKRNTDSARVVAAAADAGVKPVRKIGWTALMGTMVVVVLALGGWLLFLRKARPLTDKDTIVLADFTNTTGDAIFDGTR
jgi:eukaryotic-like serine/threonine-protein kinase